ncbi:hypothetical protein EX227_12160 [Providencia rettgeri]|uniref:Uncharacterized protein n=1 Tax=Providencia rettgeri TaxID=587 RepID=A0AAP2JZN9_PRORE|nr:MULTISPECIES: hypothetical protein [Providencia]EKY1728137.1 hypothetical protein [Proteus mirabilis]EJD6083801.1 hypothetical protein [Providencia rettgeri]EJD6402550.1 hypothetical protein [Providencia rettgeri]EJD6600849.1 hypothetical protein [Providencia rettgeri]ELR5175014.1 hypothetical protein [Providencia rettgeri]
MTEEIRLNYHEIDFIVPAQRFNFRFSYVTKQGLSFIREFVLRLVQLAPMKPSQIATYLGLNKLEVNEAISDLMDKGDLVFNEQGLVQLTQQSTSYFESIGKPPKTNSIQETGVALSFELCGFNCIGNKRSSGGWHTGIKLSVDNKKLSETEGLAKSNFQRNFYQLLDNDYLKGVRTEGSERPSIYTIDSVSKLTQDPMRLTTYFAIDQEGKAIEREDFDNLDDSSEVHEAITIALNQSQKGQNIQEIALAMKSFGDTWTKDIFNSNSIDIAALGHRYAEALLDDKKEIPFVGPIYAGNNWEHIRKILNSLSASFMKSKEKAVKQLTWIAPSDVFWGKSKKIEFCFNEIEQAQFTQEKNPQRIYTPSIFLPLSDITDRRTIRSWKNEFRKCSNNLHGLIEGFLGGSVEVIVLEKTFAVVCYHVSRPETHPVSIPVGFITTDLKLINTISDITQDYIGGSSSFNKKHNLGLLDRL